MAKIFCSRHIDTAQLYNNEGEVGHAIKESGIPRDQIFVSKLLSLRRVLLALTGFDIATKLMSNDKDYDSAAKAIDESLERLQLS